MLEALLRPVALLLSVPVWQLMGLSARRKLIPAHADHIQPIPDGGAPVIDRITKTARQDVYAWIDGRFTEFVEELRAYARVPTISARREAEAEGADATRALLERHGIGARLMDVPGGPPMVVGEVSGASSAPPLILYNHYDVQPVDPIGEWRRPPFDPVVEDGKLFARGVADTKGNTVAQAFALHAVREVVGTVPVSLRFMVEGEEEVGSPHLPAFARQHPAPSGAPGRRSRAPGTPRRESRRSTWGARGSSTSMRHRVPDGGRGPAQLAGRVAPQSRLAASRPSAPSGTPGDAS